jgi:ribose/xylose/arabinose/galactoside ABC-type transport system permease subunit
MERSSSGKRLYAVGANNIAARYVGIDSRKVKLGAFVISAVLCGFAGIMQSSMLNSASPYMGETALLNALTMLMLGGMFFRIGVFNIPGTLVGAFLVTMLNNGLTMMGIPTFVKYLIQGFIMLISVISITIIRRKMEKLMSR